ERAQQRGLAAAVGTDHGEDLARVHVERRHLQREAAGVAEADVAQRDDAGHAGSTWIDPRWIENSQRRSRSISRISYTRWGTSTSRSYVPCAGAPGSSRRMRRVHVVPKSSSATISPRMR